MRSGATDARTRTRGSRARARPATAATANGAPSAASAGSPRTTAASAPATPRMTQLASVGDAFALIVLRLGRGRGGHLVEDPRHHGAGVDAPHPQLRAQHEAMRERRDGDGLDVVGHDEVPPLLGSA